jgi:hypothetical protein
VLCTTGLGEQHAIIRITGLLHLVHGPELKLQNTFSETERFRPQDKGEIDLLCWVRYKAATTVNGPVVDPSLVHCLRLAPSKKPTRVDVSLPFPREGKRNLIPDGGQIPELQ